MASGRVHATITQAVIPLGSIGAFALTGDLQTAGLVGFGSFMGFFLEPDLDIDHITYSERWLIRRLPPLGWLWYLIWLPYGKAVAHRSPLSHMPGLGTAIRWTYIAAIFGIVLTLFNVDLELLAGYVTPHQVAYIFLGNVLTDSAHWLFDRGPLSRRFGWRGKEKT